MVHTCYVIKLYWLVIKIKVLCGQIWIRKIFFPRINPTTPVLSTYLDVRRSIKQQYILRCPFEVRYLCICNRNTYFNMYMNKYLYTGRTKIIPNHYCACSKLPGIKSPKCHVPLSRYEVKWYEQRSLCLRNEIYRFQITWHFVSRQKSLVQILYNISRVR